MSETRFTPGPWVAKGSVGNTLCVTDKDSRYVVDRFVLGSRPDAEHEHNARLIAAAPEMYAVLRDLAAASLTAHALPDLQRRAAEVLRGVDT